MQLKSIELAGFKSFPDKTRLSFEKSITVIVGPNGSGKSNIADAIMWVTGEQSTKSLRGSKMEDVIFGGTQRRPQMGYAEVSLTLDNQSGTLDVENTEVVLTRRYYRSGESEYYLNRKQARLRDILEILMDTGLGREGYSVIGQGKIDEILSVRSRDRRDVFEEAVGISRYRHRREEAERKLAQTQENLLRIDDKISELELTLDPLREQSETARRYLLLRDELRALEVNLWARQLTQLRDDIKKSEIDLLSAEAAIAKASEASERLYADIEELEASRRECDTEAETVRSDASELERALGELAATGAALRARLENNISRIEGIHGELSQQSTREDTVLRQIEEREVRVAQISVERARVSGEIDARSGEMQKLLELAESEERKHIAVTDRERAASVALAETRALISSLATRAQELLDGETSASGELSAISDELIAAKTERERLSGEAVAAREASDSLQNALRGYELRVTSRRNKLAEAETRASKAANELGAVSSRANMLAEMEREYEGYSKAVRLVMQDASRGALKNIYGTAGSLIKTGEKYALAIETALGGSVQSIIVQSEEDGKAAINMLKRRDGGRATFLPVSTVRGNTLAERGLTDETGFEGLAIELSEFDENLRGVYASLLGRVAIVGTLDDAIRISRKYGAKFKVVTLDGQVINAGGAMTGGSAAKGSGIISRAGELARLRERVAELEGDARAAKSERDEREREKLAAEFELESARAEKLAADETTMRLQNEFESAERILSERENALEETRARIESLRERSTATAAEIETGRAESDALETELQSLRAEISARGETRGRAESERESINTRISELRAEIAALDAEEEAVAKAISELSDIRTGFLGEREARLETAESLELANAEIRAELTSLEAKDAEIRAAIEAKRAREGEITARKLELERRRTELDRRVRDASGATMELERERSRLEQAKLGREAEERRVIDRLWDSYELTRGDAMDAAREVDDVPAANRRVSALRSEISGLGNPNIGAIEEFERVNTRYTFLTAQRDDVMNAKSELDAIIEDITAQMRKIFEDGFVEIKESFSETFVELFGGGSATLTLEDPDDPLGCGIEIAVQPPGKALKTLTLLSGGERAFAAIALYFAILKIRPAPFVVLDEIEAALDDANVIRFADYMRRMSLKTQMIVISHRRGTMEEADVLYGVTMQERGISRVIVLDLEEAEKTFKLS
ncbi:MAG: chromosome segregation protein SMC [Oscillospiraceae bacterium]|nr:chromosome segregation protein SMC [Oscillospiraceae bacterium]